MKRCLLLFSMLLLTGLALAAPDFSVAGINDPGLPARFLTNLQQAVARGQTDKVAQMVNYPLRVNHDKSTTWIKSAAELTRAYPKVFTAPVRKAIADTKAGDLFCNYQGVMLGGGAVWFGPLEKDPKTLKIITVNN